MSDPIVPTALPSLLAKRAGRASLIHEALLSIAKDVLDPVKLTNYTMAQKLHLFEMFSRDEGETVKTMAKLDIAKQIAAIEVVALYQRISGLSTDQRAILNYASSNDGMKWLMWLMALPQAERDERFKQAQLPMPKVMEMEVK